MVYYWGNQINVFLSRKKTYLHDLKTIFRMSRRYRTFSLKIMVLTLQSLMGIRCHCTTMKTRPRKHWHSRVGYLYQRKLYAFTWKSNCFYPNIINFSIDLKPEFIFKGKGTRTKLNLPSGIKFQWSESGSYRTDQLKQTIMNLLNRFNLLTCKDFAIYVFDDNVVHLMPERRKLLWEPGYVLIIIGGGITGYI